MRITLLLGCLVALTAAAGCSKNQTQATEKPASVATTGATAPPASPAPATPAADKPATTDQPDTKPAPKLADLPPNLKNDAYEYFGLSNDKPLQYTMSGSASIPKGTLTCQATLKAIADGKASFEYTQKGIPSAEMTNTVSLEPNGIYIMSMAP
ncbi:MAG TPA: hypothetical protein VG944_18120, partial [Fimbriimonas sp.]|nr:hypothetical protein [Fimbriimonas sp.]